MIFVFQCPNCDGAVKADSAHGGDIAVCPHCDATLMVPMDAVGTGTLVGGYKLLERLGSGGMGTVYLAEQISLKRQVALKVLPPAITRSEKFVQRFHQEVKMHGQLAHPRIAMAYDAGNDRDIHYLAMEYVKGMDVGHWILKRKMIPEKEAMRIALAVAEGLRYAWDRKRIVHCDIKPGNIMLMEDGDVKILDLGLSKSLIDMADLTQTGYMVGTPFYMSPEQSDGEGEIDFRSDIYSLGSTLYHMVTGVTPYSGRNVTEVIMKKNSGDPPSASAMCNEVGEPCSRLITKMMARRPEDRFQSYDELMTAIREALDGRIPTQCCERNVAGRLMWGLAGLVLAATVAGIAHKVVSSRPPPRPLVPALSEEDRARKRVRDLYQFAQERAELNSDELQIHLDTFHAVKKEAEAIGYVEVARMAAERIAYYQDRRDREVNRVIVLLRNSAEELAAEGNLVGAQTLLLSYEGPYRRESEARRIELWKTLEATVQERLRHEDEVMLKNTRARVETLLKEKKIEDASKVVASLRQSGRPESRLEREYLAVELGKAVEAARQEYETEQEKMRAEQRSRLASLADLLLSGNLQAAGYVAQAAEAGPLREQMIADVRRIARTGSIILGSFTRDIGKDVDLWLVEGPRTYRILEVRETEIVAARAGSDGRVTVSLGLADMTSGEKVRRLVAMLGEPDAAIPCGMLAWAARNPVAAAGYFEKAGTPLGRELATRALAGMQEKNTGDSASTAKENP